MNKSYLKFTILILFSFVILTIQISCGVSKTSESEVKRVGMVIKIRKDKIEEYKRLHSANNPGVRDLLNKYNLRNFSIFLHKLDEGDFNEFYWITPDQRENAPDNKATRDLYLPKDNTWFNFWTGETVEGGQEITVDGRIEQPDQVITYAGEVIEIVKE